MFNDHLTMERSTSLSAVFQRAVPVFGCVLPGSERGFCGKGGQRHTCLLDMIHPTVSLDLQPAEEPPLCSLIYSAGLRGMKGGSVVLANRC